MPIPQRVGALSQEHSKMAGTSRRSCTRTAVILFVVMCSLSVLFEFGSLSDETYETIGQTINIIDAKKKKPAPADRQVDATSSPTDLHTLIPTTAEPTSSTSTSLPNDSPTSPKPSIAPSMESITQNTIRMASSTKQPTNVPISTATSFSPTAVPTRLSTTSATPSIAPSATSQSPTKKPIRITSSEPSKLPTKQPKKFPTSPTNHPSLDTALKPTSTRPPVLVLPVPHQDNRTVKMSNLESVFGYFETKLHTVREAKKHQMNLDKFRRLERRKLCYFGSLGNIDELINVVTRLLFLGEQLDRIVALPYYFSVLYDVYLMDTAAVASNTSSLAKVLEVTAEQGQAFCDPRDERPNITTKWDQVKKWPDEFQGRDDTIIYIGGLDLAAHEENGLFASSEQQTAFFEQLLFTNLFPYKETRMTVHGFITKHFSTDSFAAIHLDVTDADQAIINPALVQFILKREAPDLPLYIPIFISVSPEFETRHADIVRQFRDAGAVSFDGPCFRLYECDMVVREIAAHSAFFYGMRNSSTSIHIENLRRWRFNVVPYKQYPALIKSYSIQEATQGGWQQSNEVVVSTTTLTSTSAPTLSPTGLQSHYQAYLSKLERTRPEVVPREVVFPPNGVICQLGAFGQLNNLLIQSGTLVKLGEKLNRTVVLLPLISELFDVTYIEDFSPFAPMKLSDGSMYQPSRVSMNVSLCDPGHGWKFLHRKDDKDNDLERFSIRQLESNKAPVLVLGAKDSFQLGFSIPRTLLKYLHPHKNTRSIAIDFIEKHFGDKPFVAVHLRFLDGYCYKNANEVACDADPELLQIVLKRYAPQHLNAPVFVASDHQRPDLELAFVEAGAVFYRGKCNSYDKQCMLIDEEIAARSVYFFGLHASTAALNIEKLRQIRDNGTPYKQPNAFPRIRVGSKKAPTAAEWTSRKWYGGDSPEKYFASLPKKDNAQMAATLPPK